MFNLKNCKTMKKNFVSPAIRVVVIDSAAIICSSTCPNDAHGGVCDNICDDL